MLVLRLLVMVLTIICLMDGHAEVSSSTTGIRDRRESPAVKTNELEVEVLDRKKKKKPKPSKKKKPKPGKKKPKPNKAKPKPTKPVTTTTTMSTSTLKTTTILTTPTIITTPTTTTTTVSPTTTATTTKTTTSTASATTTLSTTTSATTTVATSSTASTATTTITTTAKTSSLPTTAATTADSGAGGECKATNGKPCIFPFKDGKEYNECKNEGGKYFWCATSVYDSGKYKHWSYCSTDGPCPLEGDGECRAENNKPCVFPFKDGNKEYNECADYGGKYFWCATGTNSAGKYTAWSECPKDGSCPLSGQGTTPTTSTTTTASTTPPINDTSAAAIAIANVENALTEINDTLQNLETAGFSEDEKQLLETMNDLSEYMESGSETRNWNFYDAVKINFITQQLYSSTANIKASKQVNPGFKSAHQSADATCSIKVKNAKLSKVTAGPGRMFQLDTISEILGIITNAPFASVCCAECKILAADTELFEHSSHQKQCDCYKTKLGVPPLTMASANLDSGVCLDEDCREATKEDCPSGHTFIKGGFTAIPYGNIDDSTHNVDTKCECRKLCDIRESECKAFLFKTCGKGLKPNCILLNEVNPTTNTDGQYNNQYAFCRRDTSNKRIQRKGEEFDCGYTWGKSENIFTDLECVKIRNHPDTSPKDCIKKCTDTPTCSAFNILKNGNKKICQLRECHLPIRSNPNSHKGYFKIYEQNLENVPPLYVYKWEESTTIFTDAECMKINKYHPFTNLDDCKNICSANSKCTAINVLEVEEKYTKICELRSCMLPVQSLVATQRGAYFKQWLRCPALYTNIQPNEDSISQPNYYEAIRNIQACYEFCQKHKSCKYWTWKKKKDNRHPCFVMNGFSYSFYDKEATTGYKNCNPDLIKTLDCPTVNTNTIEGTLISNDYVDSESLEDCSKKCFNNKECNYWTWTTVEQCYLMSDYKSTEHESNVFTGEKACHLNKDLWCPMDKPFNPANSDVQICRCGVKSGDDPKYCNPKEWCSSRDNDVFACLPACDDVRDTSLGAANWPTTNACVCKENNVPCEDGSFCDQQNKCQKGECEGAWLTQYQGIRPNANSVSPNKILNGIDVKDKNRWPWAAQIQVNKRTSCSGVLITCQHVLTAAHCIVDTSSENLNLLDKNKMNIILGSVHKNYGSEFDIKDTYFKKGGKIVDYTYPDGKTKYYPDEDIAIVKLERPVNPFYSSDEGIRPIYLPSNGKMSQNDELWIAGWGAIGGDSVNGYQQSNFLRETSEVKYYEDISDGKFFQLKYDDVRPCPGDSGSPGMVEELGIWYVKGINSRGPESCEEDNNDKTGQAMNVFTYLQMITDYIKS